MRRARLKVFFSFLLCFSVIFLTVGCFGGGRKRQQTTKPVITKPKTAAAPQATLPASNVTASEFSFKAPANPASKGFDDIAGHAALAPPNRDLTRVPPDAGKLIKDPTLPPPKASAETSPDYLADALGIKVNAQPPTRSSYAPRKFSAPTVVSKTAEPGVISDEPLESVSFSNSRGANFGSRPQFSSKAPGTSPPMGFMPPSVAPPKRSYPPITTATPTYEKPQPAVFGRSVEKWRSEPIARKVEPAGTLDSSVNTNRRTYVMQRGDTLSSVARAHGVSFGALLRANSHLPNPDVINAGDTIMIPSN